MANTNNRPRHFPGSYSGDFSRWAKDQAKAIRSAPGSNSIDWKNVAEEIDALGKSQERELGRRIANILVHLIKLQVSPAIDPRSQWRVTVRDQRDELERLLEDEYTLKTTVSAVIEKELPRAKRRALEDLADYGEKPTGDTDDITFSEDQVLEDWYPEHY